MVCPRSTCHKFWPKKKNDLTSWRHWMGIGFGGIILVARLDIHFQVISIEFWALSQTHSIPIKSTMKSTIKPPLNPPLIHDATFHPLQARSRGQLCGHGTHGLLGEVGVDPTGLHRWVSHGMGWGPEKQQVVVKTPVIMPYRSIQLCYVILIQLFCISTGNYAMLLISYFVLICVDSGSTFE